MEEAVIKRVMPHSTEAEQAVIGAMLMNKDAIMETSEILHGEDFYQTAYGILFDAMVEMFHSGTSGRSDHTAGTFKRKKCSAGNCQYGVCP